MKSKIKEKILSADEIKLNLNNLDFFHDIIIKEEITSTNDVLKEMGKNGAKSGTVLVANRQTKGKGRLDRNFFSPPSSGIYMSVLLKLENSVSEVLLMTSGVAVAVCRAIEKLYDINCQIKWVNDIYVNEKKLCGILCDASMSAQSANKFDFLVIGIGINVDTDSFPTDIADRATAICECVKTDFSRFSRNELIAEILNELYVISNDLHEKKFLQEYKSRSCILGEKITVYNGNVTENAVAIDINDHGHLIVKRENGEIYPLNSGEITIRKIKN